jgi:IPT/TIG domain
MKIRYFTIALCALLVASCGSSNSSYEPDVPTDSPPIVSRVDPATGPAGTVVTIYGFGFSYVAPINIISIGDSATPASSYSLLATPTPTEIEALEVTLPAGITAGASPVIVIVHENASNSDITFTVTP